MEDDDIYIEEHPEEFYNYHVIGFFDGEYVYKAFPNYKSAFSHLREITDNNKRKSKWFIELYMFTYIPFKKGEESKFWKSDFKEMTKIYEEGTYSVFVKKSDKVADEAIKELFTGEKNENVQ